MRRILVVNVNWLGDAILTTPVFRALEEKYPSSYVAVMCVERVKEVFENNPYVDEIIIFDEKSIQNNLGEKLKFAKFLKAKNFDTAFLIHRSFTRAFICMLAGIKIRVGYKRLKNFFVLTNKIIAPAIDIHRQDYYFYLFEKTGIFIKDKMPKVFINPRFKDKFRDIISETQDKYSYIVGINASANWLLKRWPTQNFAALCDRLVKELNCAIIFICAAKDRVTSEEIIRQMNEPSYNLCGQTNLKELAALMEVMNLFTSNDSGPAHLAAAVGIPTIALFGPTSSKITSPRGKYVTIIKKDISCKIPCYKLDCKNNICMTGITVDEVFLEAKRILSNTPTKA
ncbi:MAG: lipopolysaccharide heptosyltransferase II [Candidatus Omnitrophota bacterium]|nr:lipopolysaccharide heptosyltransferase II [Candidatus Omnitrophota bacterium]